MAEYTLGVELGSTRIKSVLIDSECNTVARGSFAWENKFENGYFTYSMEDVWQGLACAVEGLLDSMDTVPDISKIGISGMMHGYLPLGEDMEPLVPFRTWRNTTTQRAAKILSEALEYNMPMRWSAAHLYQAALNGEGHVNGIRLLTTLSGYVHYHLTGNIAVGMNEASGMFPFDIEKGTYKESSVGIFDRLMKQAGADIRFYDIMPRVYPAGSKAGTLTERGALLLDRRGRIRPGTPLCPPEGDSATGMIATGSIRPGRGNVSMGTSAFATVVTENELTDWCPEIDTAVTPDGRPVAMVHCNNCTYGINSVAGIVKEAVGLFAPGVSEGDIMTALFEESLKADAAAGGVIACNYLSGEHITGFEEGRPLIACMQGAEFSLANLMRAEIYSSLTSLAIGAKLLREKGAVPKELVGHGGFFKTPRVAMAALSAAMKCTVTLTPDSSEGGAWGIALLASYMGRTEPLADYLDGVLAKNKMQSYTASEDEMRDFEIYLENFKKLLEVERTAVENI